MPESNPQDSQPQSGFERAFNEFLEHQRRALDESGKALDALLPPGFKEHGSAAAEEFRKGLKVLVDYTIDELEKVTKSEEAPPAPKEDDEPPPSTTGRSKVKVQVE